MSTQNYVGPVTIKLPDGTDLHMQASLHGVGSNGMEGSLSGKNVPPGLLHGTAPFEGAKVLVTLTQNYPPLSRKFVITGITSAQNTSFIHIKDAGDWLNTGQEGP